MHRLSFACRSGLGISVVAAALLLCNGEAAAQSEFTYQGRLKVSGSPYNGSADLRFTLYDAAAGGSVIGAPVAVINSTITEGLVSAGVDFGLLAFDGSQRWLQIEVRTPSNGGAGPYVALTTRQAINPSPYALHAAVAGLVPDSALDGTYSNALSMTNAANLFAGDGSGLVNLDASNIGGGVLGDGRLGGTYSDAMSLTNAGNAFAGDGSALSNLDWNSLINVPAGFADGIDNTGVGTSQWTGTAPNSISYLPGVGFGVGIGNSTPDGRLHITGGPGWTTNGWTKSLTLDTAAAIEFGKGGTTKFGVGASQNGMYFFNTSVDTSGGDSAHYYMWANAAGHVFMGNAATITGNSPLTVGGTGADWAIYGQAGSGGAGVVGAQAVGTGRGVMGIVGTAGFCGVSGDHGSGAYGLLGTANEGIYGNGGANGKVGITGVAGGSSSGVVASHVGASTSAAGLFGNSLASNGNGVIGEANVGTAAYAVWGRAAQGIGGYFSGGTYALIAAGRARVNTIEIIGGSDLAEPFDIAHENAEGSSLDIEPGMVVVIDPANPGSLKVSTEARDRKVAGIISGANDLAPGMVMKSEGGAHVDGDHPVALTGRVWCWCDAMADAVEPGDMLTTSDTPGHAMKVSDLSAAQGAIIGKAMTPLARGERGLVLVLVNLQ